MIYFQVIIIAIMLTFIAERTLRHKFLFVIFSMLSIVGPVWLAASRDLSIGYDVKLYLVRYFNLANSGIPFLEYCNIASDYFLFELLVFGVTKLTRDIGFVMGAIELVICVFFYLAAFNNRKRIPMWLFMAAFYCFGYIYSFNLMKQFLAISIIVFSMKYYETKQWGKWGAWVIIASLFHISILMILIIPVIDWQIRKYSTLLNNVGNEKREQIKAKLRRKISIAVFVVVIICAFIFFGLNSILQLLIHFNLFAYKASAYLTRYAMKTINFEMYKLIYILFWLILLWISRRKFLTLSNNNYLLIIILMFYFGFTLLGGRILFLERTGLNFGFYPMCAGYGQIAQCVKVKCGRINLTPIIILLIFGFMCWWQFVICNQASAYPYVFR